MNSDQGYPICEFFFSEQGEGPYQNTPSVFLRFAGCTLKCTWCDTKYSWHPDEIEFTMMTMAEIVTQMQQYSCEHIVITGGEPLLQQQAIQQVRAHFPTSFIEIETSGSVALQMPEDTVNHFNISPKLNNSGNLPYDLKLKPKNSAFKFVVQSENDINEIKDYLQKWELPTDKIWLMPEGQTAHQIEEKTPWIQQICQDNNWHFTSRLHILKYGAVKGK